MVASLVYYTDNLSSLVYFQFQLLNQKVTKSIASFPGSPAPPAQTKLQAMESWVGPGN